MRDRGQQPDRWPGRAPAPEPGQSRGAGIAPGQPIRLLALDLDGTIVSPQLTVDPLDEEALRRAETAGVTVVVCTGRPFPGAMIWVTRLELKGPLICYQGAQVRLPDGSTLLDSGVRKEVAIEVIRFCRERDLHVQAYRDDRLLIERDRPEAREYADHAQMEINLVPDLEAAMGPTTPKLVIVAGRERIEELLPEVRSGWAGRLNAATSMPTYLEMTGPRADKRSALRFLARRLRIPQDQVAAAGDGRNDEPMISWAGLGFAVAGAAPEVIAAAQGRIIAPPGGGGISQLVDGLLSA
ncbi:MAG: Cof-type HAD-IIB family hydrolase [Candidatus Dormibacteraceae bacterium]